MLNLVFMTILFCICALWNESGALLMYKHSFVIMEVSVIT